jgi:MFS family permease
MSQLTQTKLDPAHPSLDDARRRKGMFFLGLAVGAIGFAMMLQMGLNDNFLVEDMHLDGLHKGLLEAIRESCGIFAVGILALIVGLREPVIGTIMLILLGLGLGAYAGVQSFASLAICSFIWSQGLHVWMPLPNSMVLAMAEPGKTGKRLGELQKYGAVGSALALGVALTPAALSWLAGHGVLGSDPWDLAHLQLPLRPMYIVAGAIAIVGGVCCLGIPRDIKAPGQSLVFRKKYWLYYLLCFLEGWRKQIFLAFAGFLLVKQYGLSVTTMLLLWVVIQVISWAAATQVGKLVDRLGERKVLVAYYSAVTLVFLGYSTVTNVWMLKGLFVLDNTFFLLAMALTTYVRRIAPIEDHTATLSMGVAFNHVAAVLMPLVGGWLWSQFGYQAAFRAGIVAAVLSIFVAMLLPQRTRQAA